MSDKAGFSEQFHDMAITGESFGVYDPGSSKYGQDARALLVAEAFPAQQAGAPAMSGERPHNYTGVAVDIGNGVINEFFHPIKLLETYGESAVAGYGFRCAPAPIKGAMLAGGLVLGVYEVGKNAPTWYNDASTIANESSYTAQENARAHAGLEHFGGGIVELGVGVRGFNKGLTFPEREAALGKALDRHLAGEFEKSDLNPNPSSFKAEYRQELARRLANSNFEPPEWVGRTTDRITSKIDDLSTQTSEALRSQIDRFGFLKPRTEAEGDGAVGSSAGASQREVVEVVDDFLKPEAGAERSQRPRAFRIDQPEIADLAEVGPDHPNYTSHTLKKFARSIDEFLESGKKGALSPDHPSPLEGKWYWALGDDSIPKDLEALRDNINLKAASWKEFEDSKISKQARPIITETDDPIT